MGRDAHQRSFIGKRSRIQFFGSFILVVNDWRGSSGGPDGKLRFHQDAISARAESGISAQDL